MPEVPASVVESLTMIPGEEAYLTRPAVVYDAMRLQDVLLNYYGVLVTERLRFREGLQANSIANVLVRDAVRLVEKLYSAREVSVTEQIGIQQQEALQAAILLIERLRISEALAGNARYRMTVTQSMKLTASLANFFGADVLEALSLDDDLFTRVLALAHADEAVGIEAQVQPQLLVSALLDDGIDITGEMAIAMLFNPTVLEGVEISAGMIGPDGSFTTWVMNTRSGAVTEYSDYAFNSFAQMGNRYLGASADGLYELLGDTDDGDPIVSRIKGGFLQFGGTKLSRLKEAYIAVNGEGRFVLKLRTRDGEVYNYGVDTRDGRSTRIHMGKGQRSRYFAWELISVGQDFNLDTLEFVSIVVSRRV